MNEFAVIAITAILASNIVSFAGVGAVSLQSEKRNFVYMLVSSICIVLPIAFTGMLYWVINNYLLIPYEAEFISLFVMLLLIMVFALLCRLVLKKISKEEYYLYEKSYTFPIQTAVGIGTLLFVNFDLSFLMMLYQLAMFAAGFILVQVIFYSLYEKLDNTHVLKPARNVPVMLYTLSIVSIILYSACLFF